MLLSVCMCVMCACACVRAWMCVQEKENAPFNQRLRQLPRGWRERRGGGREAKDKSFSAEIGDRRAGSNLARERIFHSEQPHRMEQDTCRIL
jgi:hypothetical protein